MRLVGCGRVLELGSFGGEAGFSLAFVVMVEFAVFDWDHVVGVLLGEDLLVLQRLDSGVVVVLVYLAVDGLGDVFMAGGLDGLGGYGWVDDLLNVGVVAMTAGELADGGFGGFHCEVCWRCISLGTKMVWYIGLVMDDCFLRCM